MWGTVRNSPSIRAAVLAATKTFQKQGISEANASAEYLALATFSILKSRRDARTNLSKPLAADLERFVHLCHQREARTPIQYLVGDWDFHHVNLRVRAPVLIPRPETEELVELVLNGLTCERARVLDVGCGSGAILLAILAARPAWKGVGVDIATEAVDLSKENAAELGIASRAEIIRGGIEAVVENGLFDVLVSNPPYITTSDMTSLDKEVREFEDIRALCGGEDGLDVVREVLKWAPKTVMKGGSIWLEVDSKHPKVLQAQQFDGVEWVSSYKDLYGRERFCHFRVE